MTRCWQDLKEGMAKTVAALSLVVLGVEHPPLVETVSWHPVPSLSQLLLLRAVSRELLKSASLVSGVMILQGHTAIVGVCRIFSQISSLQLVGCKLDKHAVTHGISRLHSLKHVVLDQCSGLNENKLLQTVITRPPRTCRLSTISLIAHPLSDAALVSSLQSNGRTLRQLELCSCDVSDEAVVSIASHCPGLIELNLSSNPGINSPAMVTLVRSCPSLGYLALVGCVRLEDSVLKAITWLARCLIRLDIRECSTISEAAVHALRKARPRINVAWQSHSSSQRSLAAAQRLFASGADNGHEFEQRRSRDGMFQKLHTEICRLQVHATQTSRNPHSHRQRLMTATWTMCVITNLCLGLHIAWVLTLKGIETNKDFNARALLTGLLWQRRRKGNTKSRIEGLVSSVAMSAFLTGSPLLGVAMSLGRHNRLVSNSRKWVVLFSSIYTIALRTFAPRVSKRMITLNLVFNSVYMLACGARLISIFDTITF